MDETQAINFLINHDLEGLAWLVERHQLKALRTAFLITGERRSAEDVVQEKFVQLPRSISSFDRTRAFEPWFLRGVVNSAIRAVNRGNRMVSTADLSDAENWLEKLADDAQGLELGIQQQEFEQTVWDGLQKLAPVQRTSIVMRYYLGMSEAEMAEREAVPAGTIKWRLSTARKRLRRWFGSDPRKEDEK
jgi:RNA polymerase sigma-70 factor (ECF subfamily)